MPRHTSVLCALFLTVLLASSAFAGGVIIQPGGGSSGSGHTIEDEGSSLTQRSNLNFVGANITCADSGGKTVCTITGGHTVEEEGSALTQRATLNFVGGIITCADSGGKTVCTIAPPGSDTYIIFNDGGTFGADAGCTYNKTTDTLTCVGFATAAGGGASGTIDFACGTAPSTPASDHIAFYCTSDLFKIITDSGAIITFPAGTDTLVGKATTDTLTNKTLDAEGTGNVITRTTLWDLDTAACIGGTASHIWNTGIITAPTPTCATGTNRVTGFVNFPDADNDHGLYITKYLPTGWTGALDAEIWWKTTGTGNARFQIATICYADDEADDAAFNTASVVTAAAGTSARPNKQTITGITTTGCAAGELMRIKFFRNRTEASDSLNAALDVEKVVFIMRATK